MKMIIRGANIGVLIGLGCSILMSYMFGSGVYYPMSPLSTMGEILYQYLSEPTILIISLICWALIGIGFMLASKIFLHQTWGTLKMTIVHFFVVIAFLFPLSVLSGWYPLNLRAFLTFVMMFVLIYIIFWILLFIVNQRRIKAINEQLNN